jgi:hypothetical protein
MTDDERMGDVIAGDGAGAAADAAVDLDDVYVLHMREAGHVVALIRPAHYLFGAASAMTDLRAGRRPAPADDRGAHRAGRNPPHPVHEGRRS